VRSRAATALAIACSLWRAAPVPAAAFAPANAPSGPQGATQPGCRQAAEDLYAQGKSGDRPAAIRRLANLHARFPGCHWAFLDRWRLLLPAHPQPGRDWESPFRQAAAFFAAERDARGEALARYDLVFVLTDQRHVDEAQLELGRALAAAAAASDKLLLAYGEIEAARQLFHAGRNLDAATRHLEQAARWIGPGNTSSEGRVLREDLWQLKGNISAELGLSDRAEEQYGEYLHIARGSNDRKAAAARYGLARMAIERVVELPGDDAQRSIAVGLTTQAAEATEEAGDRDNAVDARYGLAGLLRDGARSDQIDRCMSDAADAPHQGICLNALARQLAQSAPDQAQKVVKRAVSMVARDDPWIRASVQGTAMRVAWAVGASGPGAGELAKQLDIIEGLRSAQDLSSQPGLFSVWSDDYTWLAGTLFTAWSKTHDGRWLEQAFQVTERLRARSLLDTLQRAGATPLSGERWLRRSAQIEESRKRILARLHDPAVPQGERDNAHRDASAIESAGSELAAQHARLPGATAPPAGSEPFATLSDVRSGLARNEALLAFQIAPWKDWRGDFGGGSWLLVATRDAPPIAYALKDADRGQLRQAVRGFIAQLAPVEGTAMANRGRPDRQDATAAAATDGQAAKAAAQIYRQTLASALSDLPPWIEHLIVIPDDELHRVPFAALRRSAGEAPLALRYRFSEAPSATLWRRWRRQLPAPAPRQALILAAPPPPDAAADQSLGEGAATLNAPLPYAAREADSVARWLGGEKRVGAAVSEDVVLQASPPLDSFGLLHFATHTLIDEQEPASSGIWLSPGADRSKGDGLLRMNDIVGLPLASRVVVLSACATARGKLLHGEGVLSLARAFFQAGAKAVVGTLWSQWDDQAAALFDGFYHHLAEGASLSTALAAAQRDRIAAGAPTGDWAGVVVLGDGDFVPLPGGRGWLALHARPLALTAALAAALLLGLVAAVRHRGMWRHATPPSTRI
jgi:CHAT domain-containing protein